VRTLFAFLMLWFGAHSAAPPQEPAAATFAAYDVFVDAGDQALGAYQFEWHVRRGAAQIVGVEGGAAAFAGAPFYDPAALQGGRIVIAAFSTAADLPVGRTRVARVHLRIGPGEAPQYEVRLQACAGREGETLTATVDWKKMESKR
jgi:hypothetical protein